MFMGLRAAQVSSFPDCAQGFRGGLAMGKFGCRSPVLAIVAAFAALTIAACETNTVAPPQAAAPIPQPELPAKIRASEIVGRWGYAAFHKPQDRQRTENNAKGQCKQPYVIGEGPNGGVMMYLADSAQLQELR